MTGKIERRVRLGALEVRLAADGARAERLRALAMPALGFLRLRRHNRVPGSASQNGAVASPGLRLPPAEPSSGYGDGGPKAAALWQEVARVRWYHTINLPHGIVTPGFVDRRPVVHRYGLPTDLGGKRCLDVGTWDGFWAFELERRGAAEVVGLDVDSPFDLDFPRLEKIRLKQQGPDRLRTAGIDTIGAGFSVAHAALRSSVKRVVCPIYEASAERLGQFDLILCSEVLEHLRDPQTALENLFSITRPGGQVLIAEPYNPELEWFGRNMSLFVGTTNNIGVWWEHSSRTLKKMMQVAGYVNVEEAARLDMDNKLGHFSKIVFRGHGPPSEPASHKLPDANEEQVHS